MSFICTKNSVQGPSTPVCSPQSLEVISSVCETNLLSGLASFPAGHTHTQTSILALSLSLRHTSSVQEPPSLCSPPVTVASKSDQKRKGPLLDSGRPVTEALITEQHPKALPQRSPFFLECGDSCLADGPASHVDTQEWVSLKEARNLLLLFVPAGR